VKNQLLLGLNALHENNLIHGGIRTQSILLEKPTRHDISESESLFESAISMRHEQRSIENRITNQDVFCIKLIYLTNQIKGSIEKEIISSLIYCAPELLEDENFLSEKSDIWACGIVFYTLLMGSCPFISNTKEEIIDKMKKGCYKQEGPQWDKISPEGRDLLKSMLEVDFERRVTCSQALSHPWFSRILNNNARADHRPFKTVKTSLQNLNSKEKLKQAVFSYIISFFHTNQELKTMKTAFEYLDRRKEGRLSFKEVREGFQQTHGIQISDIEFNNVIVDVDKDQRGKIQFSEVLGIKKSQKNYLSEQNLKYAFTNFDKENNGCISIHDLRITLSACHNKYIKTLLSRLAQEDDHSSNMISFENFYLTLNSVLNQAKSARASPVKIKRQRHNHSQIFS
jgi:serine/threonine protein kinase